MTARRKCGRKVRFPTAWHARQRMRQMIAAERVLGTCDVYICQVCGGWHWGHKGGAILARGQRVVNAIDRAVARDMVKRQGAE